MYDGKKITVTWKCGDKVVMTEHEDAKMEITVSGMIEVVECPCSPWERKALYNPANVIRVTTED